NLFTKFMNLFIQFALFGAVRGDEGIFRFLVLTDEISFEMATLNFFWVWRRETVPTFNFEVKIRKRRQLTNSVRIVILNNKRQPKPEPGDLDREIVLINSVEIIFDDSQFS